MERAACREGDERTDRGGQGDARGAVADGDLDVPDALHRWRLGGALLGARGTGRRQNQCQAHIRLRDFVLDVAAYELRRNGHPVQLERQPMDLLMLLVRRRGQLVSRSEIVDALWGKDVFVDVENGVNTAIRKLRQALRDSPDAPTFIET